MEQLNRAGTAATFIAWCRRWGVPSSVLVDNGSEFRKIDMLSDIMKLAATGLKRSKRRLRGLGS
jgi:hypothetical protein